MFLNNESNVMGLIFYLSVLFPSFFLLFFEKGVNLFSRVKVIKNVE